jgi:hypothetical protein
MKYHMLPLEIPLFLVRRLALSAVFLLLAMSAKGSDNLLKNGDFSERPAREYPGWSYHSIHSSYMVNGFADDPKKNGVFIRITAPDEEGGHEWFEQEIDCEPGKTYVLTFEALSTGVEHAAYAGVQFRGASEPYEFKYLAFVADTQASAPKRFETPDWGPFSAKFTVPEGVTKIRIRIGLLGKGAAEIRLRDVKLAEL